MSSPPPTVTRVYVKHNLKTFGRSLVWGKGDQRVTPSIIRGEYKIGTYAPPSPPPYSAEMEYSTRDESLIVFTCSGSMNGVRYIMLSARTISSKKKTVPLPPPSSLHPHRDPRKSAGTRKSVRIASPPGSTRTDHFENVFNRSLNLYFTGSTE